MSLSYALNMSLSGMDAQYVHCVIHAWYIFSLIHMLNMSVCPCHMCSICPLCYSHLIYPSQSYTLNMSLSVTRALYVPLGHTCSKCPSWSHVQNPHSTLSNQAYRLDASPLWFKPPIRSVRQGTYFKMLKKGNWVGKKRKNRKEPLL